MRNPASDPRTPEGTQAGRDYFSTLPIQELRRRQDLAEQQMRLAYQQRNTGALESLQATHGLLSEAVYAKAFPDA